ncbi:hypothetical protein [Fodinicola feengrottensis]|uniref:hypothetical protein n=1 Tax=Fodinicola feengrottensis TaxID=435914 RepID=UPI0013D0DC18|nr:hypothetical protein [Fodinicola feengrottensis]
MTSGSWGGGEQQLVRISVRTGGKMGQHVLVAAVQPEQIAGRGVVGVVPYVHADGPVFRSVPVIGGHPLAVRTEPAGVRKVALASVERGRPEGRDAPANADHGSYEGEQVVVGVRPVDPADLVVLAIGVVVSLLSTPKFVAVRQHRDADGQDRGRQ